MKEKLKERSNLQVFVIVSLALHIVFLYLIPFVMPTQAKKDPLEGEGKYQLVDFIYYENEEDEVQSPNGNTAPKADTTAKEETATQLAKAPEVKKPTPEPKPEDKPKEVKGSEEPNKPATTSLAQPKPEVQKQQPNQTAAPKPETTKPAPKPATATSTKPAATPEPAKPNQSQVVTSTTSDKVLEVPKTPEKSTDAKPGETQEKSSQPEKVAAAPNTTTPTPPSNPAESGVPEKGEPEAEKKPALPSDPAATVAKYAKPVYPKNAANEKVEGIVEMLIKVETAGNIKDVTITKSSGDKRLDDVSLNTVKRGWSFNTYPYPYTIALQVVYKSGDVIVNFGELKFAQ